MLIVPGGEGARHADPDLVGWLRVHGGRAGTLVSVCTGAFPLAEAGLLDRRRVTTHWAYCATLAARFPEITVDSDPIFVTDRNVITSAASSSPAAPPEALPRWLRASRLIGCAQAPLIHHEARIRRANGARETGVS